jgi:glycosyltransferase involved in cell wall biosynthesis
MYRHARRVVCVSRSFQENLERRGIDPDALAFIPNGVDVQFWATGSRADGRRALGVTEHAVLVTYIGTVGMAHDLGTMLTVAGRLLTERPDVLFAIVGDGAELPRLKARADRAGLTNVTFTGLVPRERVPDYLAATDISLVTLKRTDVFKTVLPSKMFEVMAAGRPMILAVDGEARQILERAGAGVAVAPEDGQAVLDTLLALAADPERRREMGSAGIRFVEREFSRRHWAAQYLDVLRDAQAHMPSDHPAAREPRSSRAA